MRNTKDYSDARIQSHKKHAPADTEIQVYPRLYRLLRSRAILQMGIEQDKTYRRIIYEKLQMRF